MLSLLSHVSHPSLDGHRFSKIKKNFLQRKYYICTSRAHEICIWYVHDPYDYGACLAVEGEVCATQFLKDVSY